MNFVSKILAASLAFAAFGASAVVATAVPSSVSYTSGYFSVKLTGIGTSLCGGSYDWAYVYTTDARYQEFMGAVTTARMTGAQVTLTMTNVGGYCQITQVDL